MAANPILTMIRSAYKVLGTPYVFGSMNEPGRAGGAGAAFDCSGLTAWLGSKVGVNLVHQARQQATQLTSLGRNELRPGDLVFFSYGRLGGDIDHVGVYIGGGKMIDTSNPDSDLKVTDVDWDHFVQGGDMYRAIGSTATVPTARQLNRLAGQYDVDRYVSKNTVSGDAAARRAGKTGGGLSGNYLRSVLTTYGMNPDAFDDLIHNAVVNQWSVEEFQAAVYGSKEFTNTFPGIFNNDGSLKMTPLEYQNLIYGPNGYADLAKEWGVKFDRDRFGALIGGNVSPDEWAFRMSVTTQARATEQDRQAFNKQLALRGQKELSPKEWAEFIEGKSNRWVESIYTASSLDAARGLDINAKEANKLSKTLFKEGVNDPTQAGVEVDLAGIVAQVRAYKDVFTPELRQAGITDADLALLEAGVDRRNLGVKLQQLVRNRSAIGGGGTFAARPGSGRSAGAL